MESIAYISAVLAYLAGNASAHAPSVIAKVVLRLHRLNGLIEGLDTIKSKVVTLSFSEEQTAVVTAAQAEVKKLNEIGLNVQVHFNATVPAGYPRSRLRLELPGTSWDAGDPLYVTTRDFHN